MRLCLIDCMLKPGHSPNDYRLGKMSSSIESDRGSLLNVMNVFDRQEELVSFLVRFRILTLTHRTSTSAATISAAA